jgi:serine protease Do
MKRWIAGTWPAIALAWLCLVSPTQAQRANRQAGEWLRDGVQVRGALREVVAAANGCTVRVKCNGKDAALGAVVGPDGWILTKYSELRAPLTCRLPDGRELPARVVGHHRQYDLAMLKVEASGLSAVAWDDHGGDPKVGQFLVSAGVDDLPLALGVVSVPRRRIPPRSGVLGIQLDADGAAVKISQVFPGSGAEQAGLKPGDIVTRVADTLIDTREALTEAIRKYQPGETLRLLVRRGEEEIEVTATLTLPGQAVATNRGDLQNRMGGALSFRSVDFPAALQHDTALRPSDCGGPVVDLSGRVVGINIARAGRTESYLVPGEVLKDLMADLMSGKLAPTAELPAAEAAMNPSQRAGQGDGSRDGGEEPPERLPQRQRGKGQSGQAD